MYPGHFQTLIARHCEFCEMQICWRGILSSLNFLSNISEQIMSCSILNIILWILCKTVFSEIDNYRKVDWSSNFDFVTVREVTWTILFANYEKRRSQGKLKGSIFLEGSVFWDVNSFGRTASIFTNSGEWEISRCCKIINIDCVTWLNIHSMKAWKNSIVVLIQRAIVEV